MPIYEHRCLTCDEITEVMRPAAQYKDPLACGTCGGETKKIISRQVVHPDFEAYYDDNLESQIKSKKHRQMVMREKGVTEAYGKGWR